MLFHKLLLTNRRKLRQNRLLQIAFISLFWLLGETVSHLSGSSIPGGIVGLFIVLILLAIKKLNPHDLQLGTEWFLAEMLLFFVPAVPAVLNYHQFLGWLGIKIIGVIMVGTMIVMVVTAITVDACYKLESRLKQEKHA